MKVDYGYRHGVRKEIVMSKQPLRTPFWKNTLILLVLSIFPASPSGLFGAEPETVLRYQTYSYTAGNLVMDGGNWTLKYGGPYWKVIYTGEIDSDSIKLYNFMGGEPHQNWGAYVWNAPSDDEVIISINYYYNMSSYLDTFHAALFADTKPILNTGDSGTPPPTEWEISHGLPHSITEGTTGKTFTPDQKIQSIGLGFYDTSSDNFHYIYYDTVTITTVKPVKQYTYSYSAGQRLLNNGDWTLKYGGSFWTTLFTATLTDTTMRFANTYGGETYSNWGAYVWNCPSYKEVITGVQYNYARQGYLADFKPTLFAQDHAIVNSSSTPVIKWSVPGPGYVQGSREDSFNINENISSIGLGFSDTTSDPQNYVTFDTVNIKTTEIDFAKPYPVRSPLLPDQYVTVNNEHLSYNGNRQRFWGINFCTGIKQTLGNMELMFDRIIDAGFNAIRLNLFDATFLHNQTRDTYHVETTTVGSDTPMGRLDYAIYLARQRGIFFWFSFDRGMVPLKTGTPGDYDILPNDGHRSEWNSMVSKNSLKNLIYLDDRAQAVHTAYCKAILNHVNPYTGKTYADEEAIALYEITNENGFLSDFTPQYTDQGTMWNNLPAYVKEKIRVKWNTWLRNKYKSQYGVNFAWRLGRLSNMTSDENLADGTVSFNNGPLHVGQRPRDIMIFVTWLYNDYNQRLISELRTLASEGRGINVAPITPTGQFGSSLLRYYGAQMCGDFVSNGTYAFACQKDVVPTSDPDYPFLSRLKKHPHFENPIDIMRVKGKPYLVYETNDFRPNPFGAEYPIRVAAQMAWEDADGVFWFNWDDASYHPTFQRDEDYTTSRLPMPDLSYPNASLLLANDEVQLAAIKSAGAVFLTGGLASMPSPYEWVVGKDKLFVYDSSKLSWADTEWLLRTRAWREGVRVIYNPSVNSSYVRGNATGPTSINQGPYVRYDWADTKPGTMKINAPGVKAIVGACGPTETIGDTVISNINGRFSSIVASSQDGQPLASSESVLITMTRDSTNTGYVFNTANLTGIIDPVDLARALGSPGGSPGTAPVVVDRVSGTISAPWMAGMRYQKINFGRRCYEQGQIDQNNPTFTVTADEPLFYARLTRP